MNSLLLALGIVIASPVAAQTTVDQAPGQPNYVPVCPKGGEAPNTALGFATALLDALSYGHDAVARIDTLADVAAAAPDDKARINAIGKVSIAAYNDYLCGELAMLPFAKASPDQDTMIAASGMFLSLRHQMQAFTRMLGTTDKDHIAAGQTEMRAERDQVWRAIGPVVQIALLGLGDAERAAKDGKGVTLTRVEKAKLLERIEREFPALPTKPDEGMGYAAGFAWLYRAFLTSHRAADE